MIALVMITTQSNGLWLDRPVLFVDFGGEPAGGKLWWWEKGGGARSEEVGQCIDYTRRLPMRFGSQGKQRTSLVCHCINLSPMPDTIQ